MSKLLDRALILTDLNETIRAYDKESLIAFDLETDGLDRFANSIMVVSLAAPGLPPAVLHVHGVLQENLIHFLNRKTLLGHNITSFDIPFLVKYGYDITRPSGWIDTLILEQLAVVSDRRGISKSLAATAKRRLGVEIDKNVDHAGWSNPSLTAEQLSYAASDVQYLHRVYAAQMEKIRENGLESAWATEVGATRATSLMTTRGVPIVLGDMQTHLDDVREEMEEVLPELQLLAGMAFNPNSAVQVRQAFKLACNLDVESTDVDALHKLTERGGTVAKLAAGITQYRGLRKASMYNESWMAEYVSSDGRVRSTYKQLSTDTGRYSCSDPNIQQWPRSLRSLIGYEDGADRRLLSVDYSQIEILISALLCKEQRLVEEVLQGDVHTHVASLVFGVPPEEIDKDMRKKGKAAGFTLLFAGGATGVMRSAASGGLHMTPTEAKFVRDQFFEAFPLVSRYIAGIRYQVDRRQQTGGALNVRVPQGPLRSLHGASLTGSTVVNTMVQGAAAVGLKKALRRIVEQGMGQYLCGTVHDEILLDVPADKAGEIQAEVEECMKAGMEEVIGIRPKVEGKVGLRWG